MKNVFLIILLFISKNIFAQYDNNWVLGQGAGGYGNNYLQFSGINPPIITMPNETIPLGGANTSISNSNGNLFAFATGFDIYDASFHIMQGGGGISPSIVMAPFQPAGSPCINGNLFLPYPDSSNLYCLIHSTGDINPILHGFAWYWPDKIYYSIIDATLNSGYGAVTSKNNVLLNDTLEFGAVTAVRHANGRDWWIVFKRYYNNLFYSYLLTPSGFLGPYTHQIGANNITWGTSQAVFSPDGEWYVFMGQMKRASLFHFDRCTGLLSNYTDLVFPDSSAYSIGVAFSPSNRFLYLLTDYHINQYDLLSTNISASKKLVAVYDGYRYPDSTGYLALFSIAKTAPDGKIYISSYNGADVVNVINDPDSIDTLCNVTQHSIQLLQPNASSIPLYPNYYLGRLIGSPCDTIVGLNEHNANTVNLSIAPNPTRDFFWLNYDITNLPGNAELVIYNTLGEMVLRKALYNYFIISKIDCSNFSSGIYYLSVKSNQQKIASAKFVKQ